MGTVFWLAIWLSAILVAREMAIKRGRNVAYAIAAGILIGWLAPLWYLIVGDSKELKRAKLVQAMRVIKNEEEEIKIKKEESKTGGV